MAKKKGDAGRIDPNKSQIKGSRAKVKHKLGVNVSQLSSREYRKEFGRFPGQKVKLQRPVWLVLGDGSKVSCPDGIYFEPIKPQKKPGED